MEIENRVAVITGASRGLGLGLARDFLARGMRVGVCARSEPDLDEPGVVRGSVDVTDGAAVEAFAGRVAAELGVIDLWINNAGVLEPIGLLRSIAAGAVAHNLEVNVMGVVHGSQAYVRHRRSTGGAGRGVLLNVSSGAARNAYAGWAAYCASKSAVDRLTEVIALEEADHLRAYAVAPGVIDTDMQATIRSKSADEFPMVERFREMKQNEAFATPAEVAEGFLRLAFGDVSIDEVCIDLREVG